MFPSLFLCLGFVVVVAAATAYFGLVWFFGLLLLFVLFLLSIQSGNCLTANMLEVGK